MFDTPVYTEARFHFAYNRGGERARIAAVRTMQRVVRSSPCVTMQSYRRLAFGVDLDNHCADLSKQVAKKTNSRSMHSLSRHACFKG